MGVQRKLDGKHFDVQYNRECAKHAMKCYHL